MNDDAIRTTWIATQPSEPDSLMTVVRAVLEEDRAARDKERWSRLGAAVVVGVLCPVLLWCAAFGKTPLVRGGYALMAVGAAVMVFAEWMERKWSSQALPGPIDTRSQLEKTAFLLSRRAMSLRAGALWGSPAFAGACLIGGWLYQERSHTAGYLLWATVGTAWLVGAVMTSSQSKKLELRRLRVEALLRDLM